MVLKFAIQTLIELAAILLLIYGLIREAKLIAFEERICKTLKRK